MNRESAEKAAREIVGQVWINSPILLADTEIFVQKFADIIERAGGQHATIPMVERATGRTIPDLTKREHVCEYQKGIGPHPCREDATKTAHIGEVRRRLFTKGTSDWNGVVRDVTAKLEQADMQVDEVEVFKALANYLRERPCGETAWVSAADKLLTYIEAHDWGTIPEPWDSVTPLYELMYTRCPKCQNLDRRGDRTKRDHARMLGFICDDSWHDVNSAVLPSPPAAEEK